MICENCNARSSDPNSFMTCHCCDREICESCSLEFEGGEYCFDCRPQSFEYPEGFYHFGSSDSSNMSNETIKEWLEAARKKLKYSKIGDFYYTASGDTIVYGHKYEDEYIFRVCKDYYDLSVDPEDIDRVKF